MRRYILKSPEFAAKSEAWSSRNNSERKAFDVLTGLALGILADGELTAKEASFLARWIEANTQALPEKFIRKLLPVIRTAGRGEDIPDEELASIALLLESIVCSDGSPDPLVKPPTAIGTPCSLIFDEVDLAEIRIFGCEFIFTGNFLCGSKKELMDRTDRLGASAKSANPTRNTDYVVVGSKGSEQWAFSGLGRKVEHALKLREESCKLRIIREEIFIQVLERVDQSPTGQ
jgi:NAD-dependent DNA ligase